MITRIFLSLCLLLCAMPVLAQQTTIDVRRYGAKCDGTTNDSTAINNAIAKAVESASVVREVVFPAGTCRANIVITEARGIRLRGAGRDKTTIKGIGSSPALAINGMWYSSIQGLSFTTENGQSGKGVVEVDGNYDLVHTLRVQGNTFQDLLIAGNGLNDGVLSDYALTMCRQGGSSGQCSENLFLNVHFQSTQIACYYQVGYNALNNTIIGGNFQAYKKTGIYLFAGSVQVFSVGFQSVYKYDQIANDGWDIDISGGGVTDQIFVAGCRSESMRFYQGGGSQPATIRAISHNPNSDVWGANTAYSLNAVIYRTTTAGSYSWFRCTTAGTSGGSEPTWPTSGTVTDGSVVWTQLDVDFIRLPAGTVENATPLLGNVQAKRVGYYPAREVLSNYTVTPDDAYLLADPSSGVITISLVESGAYLSQNGQVVTVRRLNSSANAVNISVPGLGTVTLPGRTSDVAVFGQNGGGDLTRRWYLIGYYTDNSATITAAGTTGNQTINNRVFGVNFAAAATSLTVTNSLVSTSSVVICTVQTNDTTMKSVAAVPGSGSVVLYANAAASAETRVACKIY